MNAIKTLRDKYYNLNRLTRLTILVISIFIPFINIFTMIYIVYKLLVKVVPKYRSLNSKIRLTILFGLFFLIILAGLTAPETESPTVPEEEPIEIEQNINDNTATEEVKEEAIEPKPEVIETPVEISTTPPPAVASRPQVQVQSQPAPVQNNDLYTVASVVDGDTAKLIINGKTETLRIIGLDTPETVDPRKPVQCFGKEATAKAKDLLLNKKVRIESDSSQGERDKYGRLLLYIILPDGRNFSKVMIEDGYAFEYTYGTPYKYQKEFKEAQNLAKSQNRGLWNPNTCNGQSKSATTTVTLVPVPVTTKPAPTPTPTTQTNNSEVKKSDSGICHDTSSRYYERTIKYTAYKTIQECLDSGGRLPAK